MLRKYQEEAVQKMIWARQFPDNDLVVLPQGSGKSHVIAEYAVRTGEPVLILQPRKELLRQNMEKLSKIIVEGTVEGLSKVELAVYSASFKKAEIGYFTFATIGSVYKKPQLFKQFKTIIVDECDLIGYRKDNMYKDFFKALGSPKVVGLTATPYRLATRYKRWGKLPWQLDSITVTELINRIFPPLWNRLLYTVSTKELMDQGYLAPIEYIDHTLIPQENIHVNKSKSDFDLVRYWKDTQVSEDEILSKIHWAEKQFNTVLVFCVTISQAERLKNLYGGASSVISSLTPKKERDQIIEGFLSGSIKVVFNVNILTVGFDKPDLSCIVLLRPTRSLRLYQQMLGRGTRIHPTKSKCVVIDFSGTVKALGKIESFEVKKVDDKWEIVSEVGNWHNKELYRFRQTE